VRKMEYYWVCTLCMILVIGGCYPTDGISPGEPIYPQIDKFPAWSPDGTTIAYHHSGVTSVDSQTGGAEIDPDSVGIWFIDPDGMNRRMFLKNGDIPDWSPDCEKIALVMGKQIYTVRADAESLHKWTSRGRNFFPDWSPNGEQIAYDRTVPSDSSGVWILTLVDGQKVWIGGSRSPDWSPDGSRILYVGSWGDIWTITPDGSDSLRLTNRGGTYPIYTHPVWSPDGREISFSAESGELSDPTQIWVMDADGSNPSQLTTEGGTEPSWSPDGSRIVFSRYNPWEFGERNGRLWIMNADGSGKRQLTSF